MKTKAISKFGIIFAVALTMVTAIVFTACNSDDDFGGDLNGDITGQYSLATRMMTRAGENNNSNEEQNKGHLVLCKTVSDDIGDWVAVEREGAPEGYKEYVGGKLHCKICIYEDVIFDEENSAQYVYTAGIDYLENNDPDIVATIINFKFDDKKMEASVNVNERIYYYPDDYDLNNIPYIEYNNTYIVTTSDE